MSCVFVKASRLLIKRTEISNIHPVTYKLNGIDIAANVVGYYQEKGQPKKILRKGDALKCDPNIIHWHGASEDTAFVQLAITARERGETVWLEKVTDEEYKD